MFFEEYIIEPLKYACSDLKKIFVGGVLLLLGTIGIGIGVVFLISSLSMMFLYPMPPALMANLHLQSMMPGFSAGGIVFGIIFAVIGLILLCVVDGYGIKVIKNTLDESSILPEWADYKYLALRGFLYLTGIFILGLIFNIPNILLRVVEYIIIFPSSFGQSSPMTHGMMGFMILSMVVNLTMAIAQWLYVPLATVNFAKKDSFLGFFQIKEIISKISLEYVGILIFIAIVGIILSLIWFMPLILILGISLLANMPIVGMIVAFILGGISIPFLAFYLNIFQYRSYAKYYKNRDSEFTKAIKTMNDYDNNEIE